MTIKQFWQFTNETMSSKLKRAAILFSDNSYQVSKNTCYLMFKDPFWNVKVWCLNFPNFSNINFQLRLSFHVGRAASHQQYQWHTLSHAMITLVSLFCILEPSSKSLTVLTPRTYPRSMVRDLPDGIQQMETVLVQATSSINRTWLFLKLQLWWKYLGFEWKISFYDFCEI